MVAYAMVLAFGMFGHNEIKSHNLCSKMMLVKM